MTTRDLIVVGASAGGVEALQTLVEGLPSDLAAPVLVVLHVPATSASALPQILDRAGPLAARHAVEGDPLEPGHILVAPPDQHLIVFDGGVTLSRGPSENGHRPAVDVLFRSAARAYGSRVIGVVLSGALDDGAAGLVAVRLQGGLGLVQDPDEAFHAGMPLAAIAAGAADHVVPMATMGKLLGQLVGEPVEPAGAPSGLMEVETAMSELDPAAIHRDDPPGTPAGLSCPDCHGSLFRINEGPLVRFRCRIGHAWSPVSLLAQQSAAHESALWMALRSLEEKASLSADLAKRALGRGHRLTAESFGRQSSDAHEAAALVRELIEQIGATTALAATADGSMPG